MEDKMENQNNNDLFAIAVLLENNQPIKVGLDL